MQVKEFWCVKTHPTCYLLVKTHYCQVIFYCKNYFVKNEQNFLKFVIVYVRTKNYGQKRKTKL